MRRRHAVKSGRGMVLPSSLSADFSGVVRHRSPAESRDHPLPVNITVTDHFARIGELLKRTGLEFEAEKSMIRIFRLREGHVPVRPIETRRSAAAEYHEVH